MIKRSDSIEVSVSNKKPNGKFDVAARQLVQGNIKAHIDIIFGPPEHFTRLTYNSQDAKHEWSDIAGSHLEDVQNIEISPATHF